MNISSSIFEAYLKCPTKCFLRAQGEAGTGNLYADWVRTETESYKNTGGARLSEGFARDEIALGLIGALDVKTAKWRLAVDFTVQTPGVDTSLHAVERIPSPGRGKSAVFIPIRFIFRNKLNADDKLLLAFDAFALSSVLDRVVDTGRIIHGEDRTVSKAKVAGLRTSVGKSIEKAAALLANALASLARLARLTRYESAHIGSCFGILRSTSCLVVRVRSRTPLDEEPQSLHLLQVTLRRRKRRTDVALVFFASHPSV